MSFLARRLVRLIPVLFIVTFFSFILIDLLPSDVATYKLGLNASDEAVANLREELGLNEPLPTRYVKWIGGAVTGDLGRSFVTNQPVTEALQQRLGVTLELLVVSQLAALALAVPAGILAAWRPGGFFDRAASSVAFSLMAVPSFITAVVLVLVFALILGWFPATGIPPMSEDAWGHMKALVLPAIALAMAEIAAYMRLLRADLIATLQEDFILNARAKGLPGWWVLLRHALRPSSFSLVTLTGLNIGRLIGGALIIEVIFVLPGMGSLVVNAIHARDFPVVQGFVVLIAVGYVLANFAIDVLYTVLDPRTRHASTI